jgi:FkbM family methyltransferase
LEEMGWRGLLIEPQPICAEILRRERRNSLVFQVACSAAEKMGEAPFYFAKFSGLSGLKKNVDDVSTVYDRSEMVRVTTLDAILESVGNPKIDFLSIDVEGTEGDVLKGFDMKKYHPSLLLIEDKVYNLGKHSYIKRNGYKLVRRTGLNNWYVPRDNPFVSPLSERIELFRKMYLGTPLRSMQLEVKRLRKHLWG